MSISSGDRKGDMNNRVPDLPLGESDSVPVLSPDRHFFSPALGDHMVPQEGFDFPDNDLGVGIMNRSNSTVYSPVFNQFNFQTSQTSEMNKPYSGYGDSKAGGMRSSTKLNPPMMMLPDSVTKNKQDVSFTQLLSQISENSSYYAECMEQINHVSTCREMEGACTFPFCFPLKCDLYHTQQCSENCDKCKLLRPLILLHSIHCNQAKCDITLCSVYREAWEAFVQKLATSPIPNLDFFVTTKVEPKSSGKQEKSAETSKKVHTRNSKNQLNNNDYHDSAIKDPTTSVIPISPQLPESEISKTSMASTPLPQFLLSGQSLSESASPLPQLLQSTKPHIENSKISTNTMSVQYIVCCKCGKHRAVPSTLDTTLLPHFECSMNIWDDNKYNSCLIEENVDINYSINLSRKGPNYDQDCSHFVNKLKSFLATNQIMSYRPPTLGRKEVDLYRLFREVTAYGGCDSVVSKEGTWAKIYRGLDNFSPTETSASFRLKKMYTKYLLAYEKHIFNFLPIPAKKHRFTHGAASNTSPVVSNVSNVSNISNVSNAPTSNQPSGGIQNSAIFPPTGNSEEVSKRSVKPGYPSDASLLQNDSTGFNHHPVHQSVLLNNNTKYTPGAGIGLTGGSVAWNKHDPLPTRMSTRSSSIKRPANDGNTIPTPFNIHSDEILAKQVETESNHKMTTRSKSSRSSPIPSFLISSPGIQTRQQAKRELLSKSPLLTGEDMEGTEGLKALMGLRSSLSPMTQALEEAKWGALLSAANDDAKGMKLEPLEKLPGPAMK